MVVILSQHVSSPEPWHLCFDLRAACFSRLITCAFPRAYHIFHFSFSVFCPISVFPLASAVRYIHPFCCCHLSCRIRIRLCPCYSSSAPGVLLCCSNDPSVYMLLSVFLPLYFRIALPGAFLWRFLNTSAFDTLLTQDTHLLRCHTLSTSKARLLRSHDRLCHLCCSGLGIVLLRCHCRPGSCHASLFPQGTG